MSPFRVLTLAVVVVATGCGGKREADEEARPATRPPSASGGSLTLSSAARRAAGIEVAAATRRSVLPGLDVSGTLRPDAQRSVTVRARAGGRVLSVLADVGSHVARGQALATLEGADVTAAFARYRAAAARDTGARESLARAERLLAVRAMSRAERDARKAEAEAASAEAEAATQDLARLGLDPKASLAAGTLAELTVASPSAGTVIERDASPGTLVEKEAPLFVVADLSRLWAVLDVYEKDLGSVERQGTVGVRSDAYPGAVFEGRLALIEPTVDEQSRLGHVRVVLANPGGRLHPGTTVTATLPLRGGGRDVLTVSAQAVQRLEGVTAVFVESAEGRYDLRPVELGRESGGVVEVLRGLDVGDRVVVRGAFALKAELLKSGLGEEDERP